MPTTAKQFNANLRRTAKVLLPNQIGIFQRKIALDLFTKVILKTPVDTGRARGNWQLAIASPNKSILDKGGKSKGPFDSPPPMAVGGGEDALAAGVGNLAGHLPFVTIYLTNNVPYIGALEDGHSEKQAPQGMLKVAIHEVNSGLIG